MSETKNEEQCITIEECLNALKKFVANAADPCVDLGDKKVNVQKVLECLEKLIQELKNLSRIGDVYGPCQDQVSKLFS